MQLSAKGGFQKFVMRPEYPSRMFSPNLPPHILKSELGAGERILWSGQPNPAATLLSHHAIALFGLVWSAFSVAGLVAMGRSGQIVGVIFLLVFVSVGVFMLATPLIEYRKAKGTLLAITDRRFLMLTGYGRAVRSVDLSAIRQVERITKRSGITLRIPTALISDGDGGQKVDYTDLHGVADAERAYRLLTQRVS